MSETKHTPGPWHVELGAFVYAKKQKVADMGFAPTEAERTANAYLVAVAHLLLEACKAEAAVDQHWRECPECPDDGECCEVQTKLIANARLLRASAIAAAEKGGV